MSKLFALCLLSLCGLQLVSAGCFSLFGWSNEQRLNCHLRQSKLNRNSFFLMAETLDWFEKEFKSGKTDDPEFARFLSDVVSLSEATSGCSAEQITRAARVARETSADLVRLARNKSPAKFMIAEYLDQFTQKCEAGFKRKINAIFNSTDESILRDVYLFANNYASFSPLFEAVRDDPRKSLQTTREFIRNMSAPDEKRKEMGDQFRRNLALVSSVDVRVCERKSFESLYEQFFVQSCADYTKALGASTFDDFFLYLEQFPRPWKSRETFYLIGRFWIDHEVCASIISGKPAADIVDSMMISCQSQFT